MKTWAVRIREKMSELGITQEELGSKMGITRGAVTHYLSGRRVPPLKQFEKMAAILKVNPAWLQFGTNSTTTKSNKNSQSVKDTLHKVPLLTWDKLARQLNVTEIKRNQTNEYLPELFFTNANLFAMRVKGDSMVAPMNVISFYENDIIIIDSSRVVKAGDFVIAVLPDAKQAIFKQYVEDGNTKYLKPLNPQYPLTPLPKGTFMCGVVVQRLQKFE